MQLVKANHTEWISFRVPETVIVSPLLTVPPLSPSWLCEHATPQMPSVIGMQIIACEPCFAALKAGAHIAYDV